MNSTSSADVNIKSPGYVIPATAMFSHATRLGDTWTPTPEIVWLPQRTVSDGTVAISLASGNTRDLGIPFHSRNLKRIWNHRQTISLGDTLIFDARYETDKNIAHQLMNVAARVLLARRALATSLAQNVEIAVVLRDQAAGYSQALYRELGIPILTSDSHIEAQIVRVEDQAVNTFQSGLPPITGGTRASLALIPQVLTPAPLRSTNPGDLPDKIFISRRGSRCIVNEDEITRILAEKGFQKCYFEDEPYNRQALLGRHARQIVAIHGAALAYMLLNGNGLAHPPGDRSGLRIIELFGPGFSADLYRRSAAVLNAHWCSVRGQITSAVVRDLDERSSPRRHEATPFRVDPASLLMALDYSEQASSQPPEFAEPHIQPAK